MNNSVSICFPIFNEAKSIKKVIEDWVSYLEDQSIDYEIICSEDGSTDQTPEIIKELCLNNSRIINNHSKTKRGYTGAVISGVEKSNNEYILCIDSDGQCDPADFKKFWNNRNKLQNSFLIGNRYIRKDGIFRIMISKLFKILHSILFKCKLKDPSCPYVLFKKENFNVIKNKLDFMTEGFWWGFTACCLLKDFNLIEIDINHKKRIDGKTNVYQLQKIPIIALRNAIGLFKIKFS